MGLLGSRLGTCECSDGSLNLLLRSFGIVPHALGVVDGSLQGGGSFGEKRADLVVVCLCLGDVVGQFVLGLGQHGPLGSSLGCGQCRQCIVDFLLRSVALFLHGLGNVAAAVGWSSLMLS